VIEFAPSRTPLDRFVRDLMTQAPRSLEGLRPDLSGASEADREAAHAAWSARVESEQRSVAVFSELLGLLARSSGVPFDALCAVQRAIGDELRHVSLCAEIASFFGPIDAIRIDSASFDLPENDAAPEARAIEIVARELLVAEEESVLVLRAYRDATRDAACERALSILLTDEARHAALGRWLLPRLASAFAARPIQSMMAKLPAVLDQDRAFIRAQHALGAIGGPGRFFGASIARSEAPA
jgi:hypothetical protein